MDAAERDKRRALRFAAYAARRLNAAEAGRASAMQLAADSGASLAEIADATGIPCSAVEWMLGQRSGSPPDMQSQSKYLQEGPFTADQ